MASTQAQNPQVCIHKHPTRRMTVTEFSISLSRGEMVVKVFVRQPQGFLRWLVDFEHYSHGWLTAWGREIHRLNLSHMVHKPLEVVIPKDDVQVDPEEMPILEQVDEDIAVTQSQTNFICPITQEKMKKPVKNKVCGHIYEEEAILELIRNKEQRKKKACCPKVGCNNGEVRKSHLVPDEVLKRTIDSQSKQSWPTK